MHLPGVPIITQQPFLYTQLSHVSPEAFILTLFEKRFDEQASMQNRAATLQIHGQVGQVLQVANSLLRHLSSKSKLLLLADTLVCCTA